MRILLVHSDDIRRFPPVRNLLQCLLSNGHAVSVITKDEHRILSDWNHEMLHVELLDSYTNLNKLSMMKIYTKNRLFLRKRVPELMKTHDIIWTTTDVAVREIGEQLLNYKHVMQLMELIQEMPVNPYFKFIKFNIQKYARHAYKVVLPEINRAHITKTWWKLHDTPTVLPNKPYSLEIPSVPEEVYPIIEEMKSERRRILLYQGVFYKDRNLEPIASAVSSLNSDYCLYIMGRDTDIRKKLCEDYPDVKYIPFLDPPTHLLITQQADVGLLPYIPSKSHHFSELNALYCAPNKIFEYAAFGLPMLGSDVPGLFIPFEKYNCGVCYKTGSMEEIRELLIYIRDNYERMSEAAISYYNSVDLDEIVNSILA